MIRERALEDVLRAWGLELGRVREDIPIAGSPDRCEFRTVVEDRDGNLFVLESVRRVDIERKRGMARALAFLAGRGLSAVRPYMAAGDDEYVPIRNGAFWLLSHYIDGVPLARPEYAFEGWRGPALAEFLTDLRDRARDARLYDSAPGFSIVSFIRDLARTVETREPLLYLRVRPALVHLEQDLAAAHDRLPVRFCHGDYHPLNVIWSERAVRAVIDWEFMGIRPELFDAAMMVGCLGMEDPRSLTGDLVLSFIERLKARSAGAPDSWAHFFDLVLALRFAWLADWLKRSDAGMIELEAVYIALLLDNRGTLVRAWEV